MAQHQVETSAAEGSGEADVDGNDIDVWLEENNLLEYQTQFKNDKWKSRKEFLDYTDDDIKYAIFVTY